MVRLIDHIKAPAERCPNYLNMSDAITWDRLKYPNYNVHECQFIFKLSIKKSLKNFNINILKYIHVLDKK